MPKATLFKPFGPPTSKPSHFGISIGALFLAVIVLALIMSPPVLCDIWLFSIVGDGAETKFGVFGTCYNPSQTSVRQFRASAIGRELSSCWLTLDDTTNSPVKVRSYFLVFDVIYACFIVFLVWVAWCFNSQTHSYLAR
ncbi:uncharacterized protein EHS24_003237 [Apiotrichum porosum]|uniref:Uncharacterized protein n=1 Tax=Apiotrichum porosum TaxID=105984 RepID=A0A427XG34_9TREE|nr:uncharacterized protein EHS24_003237 [Apiotrichum porosum]RSH77674.1 hypothetical protein EHS24_003237 [Apiotrichum porosum]